MVKPRDKAGKTEEEDEIWYTVETWCDEPHTH